MLTKFDRSIQRQIIGLVLSFLTILITLAVLHNRFNEQNIRLQQQLKNQAARQDIGISIHQRLFVAETVLFKLSSLDNPRELDVVRKRFDANLDVIQNGIDVLQNGGTFRDNIATNIPERNTMELVAHYQKSTVEGYVLEVLELGPAIYEIDEQVRLLINLIDLRIVEQGLQRDKTQSRITNLLKIIDTGLQRLQENSARVLFDSQIKIESLTDRLEQAEHKHNQFRIPVIVLSLLLAAFSLYFTLLRIRKAINERNQAEQQLHLLLSTTAEGIFGIDKNGLTTFINPAASRMLGYSPEELLGKENHTLFHHTHSDGRHYPAAECRVLNVIRDGIVQTVDNEIFWCKNGDSFPVEYTGTAIWEDNEIVGAVVNFRDISQRKLAEKQIHTLSQAIEQSPVSVVITSIEGEIEYVNSAFVRATGYSAAEAIGQNPKFLKSGNTPTSHYRDLWDAISNGKSWQGEFQNCKKNGELFLEHAYIAPVIDETGVTTHFLAVKEDITVQKKQEEKILHQANYDSLTNLPNRFLTLDRLSQLINESQRSKQQAAVLFLDLDDFKKINDSMSHEIGDQLLVQAARRLRDSVRDGDTVSRLGGDEFIVLMGNLKSADDAYPVAEKLLHCFRNTFQLDGRELSVTVSIGIAIYPEDGSNPAELLRNADAAMYHSKEQGRNAYHYFTSAMNQGVSRRLQLEEQLHGALERQEFHLCYQPMIDIKSNTIVAAEALLRWNNDALGFISPDEFIPITEKTGQIVSIGQFVLKQALAMAARCQQLQSKFKIAINFSPLQFRDPDLLQQIQDALKQAGVSNDSLELEITEGVLMSGYSYIDETLKSLSKSGVDISMDDFGTGFSSLSYLRSYPFSILKIDRSFINDITIDPADRELVNAAIAMAHSLGIKVVAEGVETLEQLNHLKGQGCEIAQGYYFSKPLPDDEFIRLLEAGPQIERG